MKTVWTLCFGLVACAASPAGGANVDDPGDTQPEVKSQENEKERQARLAMDLREQCDRLGDAIQSVEVGDDEIVNLNDGGKLGRLSHKRQDAADKVAAIDITASELIPIRDQYVANAREMASALKSTAEEKKSEARKAALKRYQTLDGETAGIIERFNGACSGGGPKPDDGTAAK
jgi:hypothetical protein